MLGGAGGRVNPIHVAHPNRGVAKPARLARDPIRDNDVGAPLCGCPRRRETGPIWRETRYATTM